MINFIKSFSRKHTVIFCFATSLINKFSTTKNGIIKTCIINGSIFGLAHASNLIGGEINPVGVFVQIIVSAFMGATFCALYLRTGSIWLVIFIHSLKS